MKMCVWGGLFLLTHDNLSKKKNGSDLTFKFAINFESVALNIVPDMKQMLN